MTALAARRSFTNKRAGKATTLPPIYPNAGWRAKYQAQLEALVEEMHNSLLWWLRAEYRANPPALAMDRTPAFELEARMNRLARQWLKRFAEESTPLAQNFVAGARKRVDDPLKLHLKKIGWSVPFKMTKAEADVMAASTAENVGLIRSVAQEHLAKVQQLVMRSVAEGRDLKYLVTQLEDRYKLTRKRASLIARDQNNKATAALTRTRQQSLGVTQAIWVHSSAGKHPRPEHVKAGRDKLVYDVAKGAYLEGKWVWPGTEINCRCISRSILPYQR